MVDFFNTSPTLPYNLNTMKQKDRLRDFLTEKNLKKTAQRTLVWETLLDANDHPTVEEIRERLLERGHRVGLSTIYRTLKMFLESGLVRQLKSDHTTLYEPLVEQPNHIHFMCNQCGGTEEFSSPKIERLIKEVTKEHNFGERYSRYSIYGICRDCARKDLRQSDLNERERAQRLLLRDALELILAVERRGYSFYTNASKKTKDVSGRQMFLELAEEEASHLERLQGEYKLLLKENAWLSREPSRLPATRKIADTIFPERNLLRLEVSEGTTHIEALSIAIDLERKSHQFFSDFAKQLQDPRERKVFRDFAREERSHLKELVAEYKNLKRQKTK